MIRVLAVDDSAFMRLAITRTLSADTSIHVVGVGRNGRDAVELNQTLKPDVITLDVEMPELDGLAALEQIMRTRPTRVVMISSLTSNGSDAAIRALSLGAADAIPKDDLSTPGFLVGKIRDLVGVPRGRARAPASTAVAKLSPGSCDVVCIGSSTGGPAVLEKILRTIPRGFKPAILVAQHMPAMFTASMSKRLGEVCQVPVVHVETVAPIAPGTIYIASGGRNMHIRAAGARRTEVHMSDEPKDALYRPSADALIGSAAETYGDRAAAIILSGIGADGLVGSQLLHQKGGVILAQEESTCVVYGMPKAVTQCGIATPQSPEQIIAALAGLHGATGTRAA